MRHSAIDRATAEPADFDTDRLVATVPFRFGTTVPSALSVLPALDRINERLARALRAVIEPLARSKASVTAQPVTITTYADWQAAQDEGTIATIYGFAPLATPMMLAFDAALVRSMVDSFYGGSGCKPSRSSTELTATEDHMLGRLSDGIAAAAAAAWSRIVEVEARLRSRETNIAYAALVGADDQVAVANFAIGLPNGITSSIAFLYPLAGLRSVEHELAGQRPDDSAGSDPVWRARLADAVGGIRFQARTVLARPELSLARLMALQPGDIIPVALAEQVPMIVAGRVLAFGNIGENNGRAALRIDRIEKRKAMP
jgi:flagellar motor switch protein FliM